ncbi:MAG TPA: PD-(D/E)XK nuclease family protein [Burkholderiales bacterium]|nr:PD-(D/E)XK nuclease family protein [Burkholderiales bacterium]
MLSIEDLFSRLEEGHAAGVTVVTPNRRLAQVLNLEFDSHQASRNLTSWEAPDILPFGAFVERLYEDALYSDLGAELPLLLTRAQEQRLWEEILADSGLLAVPQAAAQCREAWELVHAWRIGSGAGNEDAKAFSAWSRAYSARTRGEVDAARLPDLMQGYLKDLKTPKLLVAYGFDVMPPQTRAFLEKLNREDCKASPVPGASKRASFPSAKHELEAAASWARARLEEGKGRIGVVVPDLQRRRKEVARIFSRVMRPGYNLPGAQAAAVPFNVSLGEPLTDYPLVETALDLLEFSGRPVPFATASRLIRSPFLGGADSELSARARLDAKLRKNLDAVVSLPKLIVSIDGGLRKVFESIFSLPWENLRSAGEWARHFSAVLEASGFPGERALDSAEFQARAKWHETLGEFSKLERVSSKLDFSTAFSVLKRLCSDTLFQPESPEAPIQVLGVFESAGLRFDCLWVSGLTDEAWPLAARPNPFLPVALQKKAGIPQASAEASLALCRRLTEEWVSASSEAVFSFPAKDGDRGLAPSPLILAVSEGVLELTTYPRYRDLLFASRDLSSFEDAKGPPVSKPAVRGGTRVFADQAACPFRAFAHYRLHADGLEDPAPGLDARDRGKLVHELMKNVWAQLKSSSSLKEDLTPAITRAAEAAIKEVGIEGRLAALERARLEKVAREWLEKVEAKRRPFQVAALEEKRTLQVAGLELSGRIDRMDKVGDEYVLIDYKGGNVSTRLWEGPRPEDPQLTIYATSSPEKLAAVTFARLKTGEMKFLGYSKEKDVLPEVKAAKSWSDLLAEWKREAESLGAAFAAGDARVDPKNDLETCRLCDLQTLCRVYEKFS